MHEAKTVKKILTAFALFNVLLLSGCLVPERFTSKVEIQTNGDYTFKYSGTAIHALAAAQIKKTGALPEKEQNSLKLEAENLSKHSDFKRAVYKGEGRYELEMESKKKAGEQLRAMNIFSVTTDKDGVITIASNQIKEKEKRDLEGIGIKIDGTLEVSLPKNAEIISQNATSSPSFFGMFGTYSWKIGRIDQRPMMKFKLKQ